MNHQEMQRLLNKDHGVLREKFSLYGRQFLAKKIKHGVTRQQQAAFDMLVKILLLEAKDVPYVLDTTKKGYRILSLEGGTYKEIRS